MKICLLSYRGNMYCGGQGIYLYYLSKELARLGHEVHVLVGPPYPDPMEWAQVHRIQNHNFFGKKHGFLPSPNPFQIFSPLNFFEFGLTRFGSFPEMFTFSIRAFFKLKDLLREHRFDIIHDNQSLGYGMLLMRSLGIPIVATLHHPLSIDRQVYLEQPSRLARKIKHVLYYPLVMQRIVTNHLDMVITVSHSSAGEIEKAFGVPAERIRVVYNGLDTGLFRRPVDDPPGAGNLIFVGNTEDYKKGLIYLLRAMRLLPKDIRLTIVDGGSPRRSFAPAFIKEYGLEGRVTFTGKITTEELVSYYCQAEIAVVPSLFEGFGFPAAEAMACELPVVATRAGALSEVVENDETGILVPPRDPGALARAIETLLADAKLRRRAGRAGRDRVERLFSWESAAKKIVGVYQEVLRAHR